MKVIDLINQIANGKAPKNIKYDDKEYYLYNDKVYLTIDKSRFFDRIQFGELDNEVEIVGDKKIEKLELVSNGNPNSYALLNEYGTKCGLTKHSKIMCDKINEIIDYINGGTNE